MDLKTILFENALTGAEPLAFAWEVAALYPDLIPDPSDTTRLECLLETNQIVFIKGRNLQMASVTVCREACRSVARIFLALVANRKVADDWRVPIDMTSVA